MALTNLGILFCDICDSSGIYRRQGTLNAKLLIERCIATMTHIVERNNGMLIDQIGDEVFCSFSSINAMANCAKQLIEETKALGVGDPAEYLKVRAGFYFGPVLQDNNKLYGETVHTAKRMIDLAKPTQILSTQKILNTISLDYVFHRYVSDYVIKGTSLRETVHELLWDQTELTVISTPNPSKPPPLHPSQLKVSLGDKTVLVNPQQPIKTIGRAVTCDLSVPHTRVSRLHAQLEYRADGFYFIDLSTNGTLVTSQKTRLSSLVRQGEIRLVEPCTLQLVGEGTNTTSIHILLDSP